MAAFAERVGAAGLVDQQTAAEAAVALAALVDSSALEARARLRLPSLLAANVHACSVIAALPCLLFLLLRSL